MLRAGVEADLGFLQNLQREAMAPHVVRVFGAWDDQAQRDRFASNTDPTTHEIVQHEGRPIGCQWIRSHADSLELVRLYLLPEAQGHGIGSHLVRRLCDRASAQGLPVRLRVLQGSSAQRLYQRLGFLVTGRTETHVYMSHPA